MPFHDVLLLIEGCAAALGAGCALGEQLGGVLIEPGVGALFAEDIGDVEHGFPVDIGLAAILAVEDRDRHAPLALAGDTPVLAVADHRGDAILAPCRDPANGVDSVDSLILEVIHGAEPLVGRAEEDRGLASPAVRILVDDLRQSEERACLLEIHGDLFISLVCCQTCKAACLLGEDAVGVDGTDGGDIVVAADVIVVYAVTGSGMYAAGTALESYVLAYDEQGFTVEERMLSLHELELGALDGAYDLVVAQPRLLHGVLIQLGRHDIVLFAALDDGVLIARTYADGEVSRQRPCGGSPDDEEDLLRIDAHSLELAQIVGHTELDVDGMAGILGILDLRLGESCLALGTPVHGLETLVDVALICHIGKDLDLLSLELGSEGDVGIVPLADDAEALELLALVVDVAADELFTQLAQLGDGDIRRAADACLGARLELGGQAVGVPSGNEGGLEARHILVSDDEVLQNLVEGVTEVDIAVGVGRAVVQHVQRLALVLLDQLVVDLLGFPALESLGLGLRQTSAHGEIGLRQIQGSVIILRHFHTLQIQYRYHTGTTDQRISGSLNNAKLYQTS